MSDITVQTQDNLIKPNSKVIARKNNNILACINNTDLSDQIVSYVKKGVMSEFNELFNFHKFDNNTRIVVGSTENIEELFNTDVENDGNEWQYMYLLFTLNKIIDDNDTFASVLKSIEFYLFTEFNKVIEKYNKDNNKSMRFIDKLDSVKTKNITDDTQKYSLYIKIY